MESATICPTILQVDEMEGEMRFLRTLAFALRNLSRLGYYHAGAELCGGTERRAKADAYRHLRTMTGGAVRAQIAEVFARNARFTVQSKDRP